jgi:hypothetical protein
VDQRNSGVSNILKHMTLVHLCFFLPCTIDQHGTRLDSTQIVLQKWYRHPRNRFLYTYFVIPSLIWTSKCVVKPTVEAGINAIVPVARMTVTSWLPYMDDLFLYICQGWERPLVILYRQSFLVYQQILALIFDGIQNGSELGIHPRPFVEFRKLAAIHGTL